MFDVILKYYDLWNGTGERPYTFKFMSASLVDQMRQNEILTAIWNNETIEPIKMISEYEEMNGL